MTTTTGESAAAGRQAGGIGLILFAMLCFAVQDASVKAIASEVSLWQLQTVRSAATLAILAFVARALLGGQALLPNSWRWPLIRSVVFSGAYLFFYASLPFLTLTQAVSAFFIGPLLITMLAALILGERIGPRRIVAVVAGFCGVLLIIRPGSDQMQLAVLLPVAAAVCYALGVITTRWRCVGESSIALTFTHNILYTVIGTAGIAAVTLLPLEHGTRAAWPFVATGWHPAGIAVFAVMIGTAVTHVCGMMSSIQAYRRDEASRIAPFEYSYLAMMPVLDLVFWGETPAPQTIAGMALIAVSGAFVARREGRAARPRVAGPAEAAADAPWTAAKDEGK